MIGTKFAMAFGSDPVMQLLDNAMADVFRAKALHLGMIEHFMAYHGMQASTITPGPLLTNAEEWASHLCFSIDAAYKTNSSNEQTPNSVSNERRTKAVLNMLTENKGNADAAAKAYDILLGCKGDDEEQDRAWLEVKKGARHYLVQCCCVAANSTCWLQVEPVLLRLFSEERIGHGGYDQEVRSQLLKAYDHTFPGARAPYYRKRERKRRNQTWQAEQPQAPPSPSVAPRSDLLEQAQVSAVVAASQIQTNVPGDAASGLGSSLPQGLMLKNTFIECRSDDDCQSLKSAKSWPQHYEKESLHKRKKKARRDTTEASSADTIPGSCVEQVDGMDSIMECDSVETLLTLAKTEIHSSAFVRKILEALEQRLDAAEFVEKVGQLMLELPPSAEAAAVACAEALGQFARDAGSDIGSEIATALLQMLHREAMQQACLNSLLDVCRATKEVLGLATVGDQVSFSEDLREKIWSSSVAVAAERYEFKTVVVQILARTQTLSRVLDAVGGDKDLLQVVLRELFYTLEEAVDYFLQDQDAVGKDWACRLLRHVAEQYQPMETCADQWIRENETKHAGEYKTRKRLVLVGVMFGPESLARLLDAATSAKDPDFIRALSRAISFITYGLDDSFGVKIRKDINKCAEQNLHQISNDAAISAVVGCIGSANKGADTTDPHLRQAISSIIHHAKLFISEDRWEDRWARSFHFEAMWTLVQVFNGAPSLGEWTDPICEIARRVMEMWQSSADEDADPDGVAWTCREASRLLNWAS